MTSSSNSSDPDFWIQATRPTSDKCLDFLVDTYGGVILDSSTLPDEVDEFAEALECSLRKIASLGFDRGYWLRIPMTKIQLVPICIQQFGFYMHHSRRDYVMLAKWTHPSKPNPIPDPSTHQVGVGCVVARPDGCLLLVKERTGPAAVGSGIWKLPTGLVEPREDLGDAAVREAKEEVGIDCVFDSVVCFRHSHGGSPELGAGSDMFFVCHLKMNDEGQELRLQESEILDAKWVHFSSLHKVTECEAGTAAWYLMEGIRAFLAGETECRVQGRKLPAWRRKNCDQWIYSPLAYHN